LKNAVVYSERKPRKLLQKKKIKKEFLHIFTSKVIFIDYVRILFINN